MQLTYSAYGEAYEIDDNREVTDFTHTDLVVYGFQGREVDDETGYLYFRNRYYTFHQGRFISRDPLWYTAGSIGLYEASDGNSITFYDAWGLQTEDIDDDMDAFIANIEAQKAALDLTYIKNPQLRASIAAANAKIAGVKAYNKAINETRIIDNTIPQHVVSTKYTVTVTGVVKETISWGSPVDPFAVAESYSDYWNAMLMGNYKEAAIALFWLCTEKPITGKAKKAGKVSKKIAKEISEAGLEEFGEKVIEKEVKGVTIHGEVRIVERQFSQEKIVDMIENYTQKVYQPGGRTVYAKKVGNYYDVVIISNEGNVISAVGGASINAMQDIITRQQARISELEKNSVTKDNQVSDTYLHLGITKDNQISDTIPLEAGIMGFNIRREAQAVKIEVKDGVNKLSYARWYAKKRIAGKLHRVYLGSNLNEGIARQKIRAYCQKHGLFMESLS